jgi:hypothetical protein
MFYLYGKRLVRLGTCFSLLSLAKNYCQFKHKRCAFVLIHRTHVMVTYILRNIRQKTMQRTNAHTLTHNHR